MKTIKLTKTGGGDYPALNIDRNNTLKKGITNGMIEMNKAFKIIWNTARGGYVVASEMQRAHGKTSRVKTAAAFALAGALALSAAVTAKTITNDNIQKETTTKLVSGDGELNIETAGDLRQLAEALKTGKLDAIRAALGVGSNAAGSTVTLVGAAGGNQYIDDRRFDVTDAMRHAPKGLELEINAGEGHQNQWSIPADELAAADGAGASELPAAVPVSTQMTQPAAPPKKDSAAAAMSEAELEAVFSRVLDKKLAPVYRELALSHDKTPGIPEIVGGMGWLIGLGGIAAWARRRRS